MNMYDLSGTGFFTHPTADTFLLIYHRSFIFTDGDCTEPAGIYTLSAAGTPV